jgi:hypothetical protein
MTKSRTPKANTTEYFYKCAMERSKVNLKNIEDGEMPKVDEDHSLSVDRLIELFNLKCSIKVFLNTSNYLHD